MSYLNFPLKHFANVAGISDPSYTVTYTINPVIGTFYGVTGGTWTAGTGIYSFTATDSDIMSKCASVTLNTDNDEYRDATVTLAISESTTGISKSQSHFLDGISGYSCSNITQTITAEEDDVIGVFSFDVPGDGYGNMQKMVVADTSGWPTTVNKYDTTVTITVPAVPGASYVAEGDFNTFTVNGSTSTWTESSAGGVWTVTAPIADINTHLDGLRFTLATNYNGSFTASVEVKDDDGGSVTPAHTLTGTWTFNIAAQNDLPTITGAAGLEYVVYEAVPISLNDAGVTDPDYAENPAPILTVEFNLPDSSYGTISSSTAGSETDGDGNFRFTGSIIDCNTAIDNSVFTPALTLKENFDITMRVKDEAGVWVSTTSPMTRNPRMAATLASDSTVTTGLSRELAPWTSTVIASVSTWSMATGGFDVFRNMAPNYLQSVSSMTAEGSFIRSLTASASTETTSTGYLSGGVYFSTEINTTSSATVDFNLTLSFAPSISSTSAVSTAALYRQTVNNWELIENEDYPAVNSAFNYIKWVSLNADGTKLVTTEEDDHGGSASNQDRYHEFSYSAGSWTYDSYTTNTTQNRRWGISATDDVIYVELEDLTTDKHYKVTEDGGIKVLGYSGSSSINVRWGAGYTSSTTSPTLTSAYATYGYNEYIQEAEISGDGSTIAVVLRRDLQTWETTRSGGAIRIFTKASTDWASSDFNSYDDDITIEDLVSSYFGSSWSRFSEIVYVNLDDTGDRLIASVKHNIPGTITYVWVVAKRSGSTYSVEQVLHSYQPTSSAADPIGTGVINLNGDKVHLHIVKASGDIRSNIRTYLRLGTTWVDDGLIQIEKAATGAYAMDYEFNQGTIASSHDGTALILAPEDQDPGYGFMFRNL